MASDPEIQRRPRILFIDAYDSFTYNIVSLLETTLSVSATVIHIDNFFSDFTSYLQQFDAVVAGPGPGHPSNPKDVGLFRSLWTLSDEDVIPVLGICLGFQSLVLAFGGQVSQLPEPRHGMMRRMRTCGEGMFEGVGGLRGVQYHSLFARNYNGENWSGHEEIGVDGLGYAKASCPLEPLAWDLAIDNVDNRIEQQDGNPDAILMAAKHETKPFYGIQFHPESICSDDRCKDVVWNWWALASKWNVAHRPGSQGRRSDPPTSSQTSYQKSCNGMQNGHSSGKFGKGVANGNNGYMYARSPTNGLAPQHASVNGSSHPSTSEYTNGRTTQSRKVLTRIFDSNGLTVPQICETLNLLEGEVVVLDSEQHQRAEVGRYSIIGIIDKHTLKLEYNIEHSSIRQISNENTELVSLRPCGGSIFGFLKEFIAQRRFKSGEPSIPFWGGLMGYVTYEACLETLNIGASSNPVDMGFAFVERSIVLDHERGRVYVQSLRDGDTEWIETIADQLAASKFTASVKSPGDYQFDNVILPQELDYKHNIRQCQTLLRRGESYELCLTTEARVTLSKSISPWSLYRRLRETNPAPFAAYLRLGPLTHISSSPERFLSWSRPSVPSMTSITSINGFKDHSNLKTSTCQFRPIKGTVKRYPNGPYNPPTTLEQATKLLATPKEKAENLMIVDLIRHDLHSVVGSGNVKVPKLMVVEEYANLFQLVTVVEGNLIVHKEHHSNDLNEDCEGEKSAASLTNGHTHPISQDARKHHTTSSQHTGDTMSSQSGNLTSIDVLAASLPPGSMTGAPKRRSCALLKDIEQRNRGVYSGVLGYMDVGGGGDFSVVIRSAFSWDQERCTNGVSIGDPGKGHEDEGDQGVERTWVIGAGGAVTCLSTEEGEWEEMQGKLQSTLGAFTGTND